MAGWYEISQASDGQYRFVLKAGNGEIILNSELYKAKASAVNGIESVQKIVVTMGGDMTVNCKKWKTLLQFKSSQSSIIGTSQFYASEASRDKGIESVKTNGSSTTIKDLTV